MMNSKIVLAALAAFAVGAAVTAVALTFWNPGAYSQTQSGYPGTAGPFTGPMGPAGSPGGYGPGSGSPGRGMGPWSGPGPGAGGPGPGMGGGMGPGMGMGGAGGPWETGGPYAGYANITMDEAVRAFEDYVSRLGSNFELIEVMEFQHNFYAAVRERDTGMGAFELLLWRGSGRISPEPGPNMMWNLKYGMMMARSYGEYRPSIDEKKAKEIALESLRRLFQGRQVSVEEAIPFYGYYTLDYSVDGKMTGMLSVNAFTGEVWYHTWHGYFIGMRELED